MKYCIYLLTIILSTLMVSCGNGSADVANQKSDKVAAQAKAPKKKKKESVGIYAKNGAGAKGSEICVDVVAENFQSMLSMQYSMSWDPTVLAFTKTQGYGLSGLTKANFGSPKIKEGKLGITWYDPALKGISIENEGTIYQLCFNAVGEPGSSTSIEFSGEPIIVEIVDFNENFYNLNTRLNKIVIK